MPITDSAKKALRQSRRRYEKNLAKKEAAKSAVKKVKKLIVEKKPSEALKALQLAYQSLDKAAKTNIFHKNKVSRLKSRLAKKIAALAK